MSGIPEASEEITVEVQPDPPPRLDRALARDVPEGLGLSRSRLVKLIEAGDVRRGAEVLASPKARVAAGDVLTLRLGAPAEVPLVAEAIPLDVIFEDADLIVVNKPAGMVVHPAPGSPAGTLVNALMHHCGDSLSGIGGEKRPGIVHRIDKDTSGLLVVAKSDHAHQGLAAQFAAHSVDRIYDALVHGVPEASDPRLRGLPMVRFEPGGVLCLRASLARHRTDRQRQAVVAEGQGRHAVTRARVEARFGDPAGAAHLACWLETGRTHQIRVHLAHIGHGLLGDPVYGGRKRLSAKAFSPQALAAAEAFPRQALHARTLGFVHPVTGAALSFAAPMPADMAALVAALGG
ncbi:RluA family pseudouridine synthase [Dinoroseobacter sp. PD6]|uniref:RluA family pseudouridine synthase n=1 Tax=Dinoroseobacter sp. PD6 TaxID=3028384 RepID=UPI00237A2181|nr:RluA family pseudouridine synthase [Dinoroseobacter sp. PD6]MDD9717693.1 RluA family pseudouridine synthase [Dinoroseobacter sp. PD6]